MPKPTASSHAACQYSKPATAERRELSTLAPSMAVERATTHRSPPQRRCCLCDAPHRLAARSQGKTLRPVPMPRLHCCLSRLQCWWWRRQFRVHRQLTVTARAAVHGAARRSRCSAPPRSAIGFSSPEAACSVLGWCCEHPATAVFAWRHHNLWKAAHLRVICGHRPSFQLPAAPGIETGYHTS